MTCSGCIHVYVCENAFCWIDPNDSNKKTTCVHFKPKSRYIELPCAVGDKFYYIGQLAVNGELKNKWKVYESYVASIEIYGSEIVIVDIFNLDFNSENVFLTKEEAEKALERSEGR